MVHCPFDTVHSGAAASSSSAAAAVEAAPASVAAAFVAQGRGYLRLEWIIMVSEDIRVSRFKRSVHHIHMLPICCCA